MLQFGLSASCSLGVFVADYQEARCQTSFSEAYNEAIGVLTTCVQTTVLVAAFDNSFLLSLLE